MFLILCSFGGEGSAGKTAKRDGKNNSVVCEGRDIATVVFLMLI